MADLDSTAFELVQPQVNCTHRWHIAPPVGELCTGSCRLCGAERNFTNQRFPFGQPGKNRKIPAPARAAGTASSSEQTMFARLLARKEALAGETPLTT